MPKEDINLLIEKYKQRIEQELNLERAIPHDVTSQEYQEFRKAYLQKRLTLYEKACNFAGAFLKVKLKPEQAKDIEENLRISHLQTTPEATIAFSYIAPLIFIILGSIISAFIIDSLFLALFCLFAGLFMIGTFAKLPQYIANYWRLKASNQMVLCIFYVVTYMRHTSNLERAIEFASQHLTPPLSLDLKKILWDVETGYYKTIKESLEVYLEGWRKYNREFVESFHLIESSLYEGSEDRRLSLLDKSLDVILEETYEKMLHYAQNLKGPMGVLNMLGIVMPILGMLILPIVISMSREARWWHLAIIYNITLPIIVYLIGRNILSTRPTGYGDVDISEINPELKKYKNILFHFGKKEISIRPFYFCFFIGLVLFLIGLSPLIIHKITPSFDFELFGSLMFLGYRPSIDDANVIVGPHGYGAMILSMFIPLSFAFAFGTYYKLRSKNVLKIREKTKRLEDEFTTALFQLGNRLGDGMPAETAFDKVTDVMQDSVVGEFFTIVTTNIRKFGMDVKDALFNPQTGAMKFFPSNIIQSSMKVLVQSIKKGPLIAAQAMLSVSRYIKEIHRVNERLRDLMSEIISDMKMQISFLTPSLTGVVIGVTSMLTFILNQLIQNLNQFSGGNVEQMRGILNMFGDGIPVYYFQIVVGVYVFELVYILSILSNGIENGADKLGEEYELGKNLIKSVTSYAIIATIISLLFNSIASQIFQNFVAVA